LRTRKRAQQLLRSLKNFYKNDKAMLNGTETIEIINAIDRKNDHGEKLSFLATDDTFSVYKKNKLLRITAREMLKVINMNAQLLTKERNQFDLVAEYILNKLNKSEKPFPDVKELSEEEGKEAKLVKV